ncbi:hypothetical protein H6P81_006485 [Aristolochia fimbriata]|uniref:Uncharacterized protein n=1 Tax=Aristolochia fimbriata TaxID=158543 RepID=A0AAV7F082_ARIFI|nr:hypothetical protein H6P81_006485 [Aristolochia fimbriata]
MSLQTLALRLMVLKLITFLHDICVSEPSDKTPGRNSSRSSSPLEESLESGGKKRWSREGRGAGIGREGRGAGVGREGRGAEVGREGRGASSREGGKRRRVGRGGKRRLESGGREEALESGEREEALESGGREEALESGGKRRWCREGRGAGVGREEAMSRNG